MTLIFFWGGGRGWRGEMENCAYLRKNPGYAPDIAAIAILTTTYYCCFICHIKSNHALLRYTACQHRSILYKVFKWKSWLSELCFIGKLVPKHSTTESKTSFLETLFSIEKVLPCSMKLLRVGDLLWFTGTNFCGSRWLKFLVGSNFAILCSSSRVFKWKKPSLYLHHGI